MQTDIELYKLIAPYKVPNTKKAAFQVLNTFIPAVVLNILAYFLYFNTLPYIFALVASVLTGLFVVRIFIIQHDCGHESFFRSKYWNNTIGMCCSLFTLTPYYFWRRSHNVHHASSGNLDKRLGIGDVYTLTTDEYKNARKSTRLFYRVARNFVFLFFIGSMFYFVLINRIPGKFSKEWKRERVNVHLTTVLLFLIGAVLIYGFGLRAFLLVQLPIIYTAGVLGTALFYFQHQFEDTYWEHNELWQYQLAALKGSSYFKMPKIMQWFTGNIGFHHIHHLSPAIPNYNLQKCYDENDVFKHVTTLSFKNCYGATKLGLWDEAKDSLVRFSEA